MKKQDVEKVIPIRIIDNNDWQPDLDFYVELYDPTADDGKMQKFKGDDTKTRVTILDEDFPGTLCFEETQMTVHKSQQSLEMKVLRVEGADGMISCTVRTQPCQDTTGLDLKCA